MRLYRVVVSQHTRATLRRDIAAEPLHQRSMRVAATLMLALVWLTSTMAVAQRAISPELHVHNYGVLNPTCIRWTDWCRRCERAVEDAPACGNLPIACIPRQVVCIRWDW